MKKVWLSVLVLLSCLFLRAADGEFTVVQGNSDKTSASEMESFLKKYPGMEVLGTEFTNRNVFFSLRAKDATAETEKKLGEAIRKISKESREKGRIAVYMLFRGRASYFRVISAEKPTVEMAFNCLNDTKSHLKMTLTDIFFILETKEIWTSAEWERLLRQAAELPPTKEVHCLVLHCDAAGYLDALKQDPSDSVKRMFTEYRKDSAWHLLLIRKKQKGALVFLKPSTGEKQSLHEELPLFRTPDSAVFENDSCRIPYGNAFIEFRRINGVWTQTADPVKNPPKNLNFGEKDAELSSLAPSGWKLRFHIKNVHPFLAEYKYELRATAPDGKTKTFPLPMNVGGGTSYDLYRVDADPAGKHGPLLILDGNYGTDILDWNALKTYLLFRPQKNSFRAERIEESPFFRKLYIQERITSDSFGNYSMDEKNVPTAEKGAPPIQDVTDWKFLSKRVYAGHIGRDGVFQTAAEAPYKGRNSGQYTLDELDPEKQSPPRMEDLWKKLLSEENVAFYKSGCVGKLKAETSFSDSPDWRLFLSFPRRARLDFLLDRLNSKEVSNCTLHKVGKLTEGQFAFLILDRLDVFPEIRNFDSKRIPKMYSQPSEFHKSLSFPALKNNVSMRDFLEPSHFTFASSTLCCNLPFVSGKDVIVLKLSLYKIQNRERSEKLQETTLRMRPEERFPSDSDGFPFRMTFDHGKKINFIFENANCSADKTLELPKEYDSLAWSPDGDGRYLRKQEFRFVTIHAGREWYEIHAVADVVPESAR